MTSPLGKFLAKTKKYANVARKKAGDIADDIGAAGKEKLAEAGQYAKNKGGEITKYAKENPGKTAAGGAAGVAAAAGAGYALSDDDKPGKKKRAYMKDC